jgi:hypothetical protein
MHLRRGIRHRRHERDEPCRVSVYSYDSGPGSALLALLGIGVM